ncbi:MAG TPA: hypothetical protein VIX86_05150 [Streptosporangiaceae bacterium]
MSSQPDRPNINQGIANLGPGTVNFNAPVEFKQARVPDAETADQRRDIEPGMRWDLGVITVLTEETRAVTGVLARLGTYRARELDDGTRFEEAVIETGGTTADAIVTENASARIDGLRSSLSVFALIALIALFTSRRIPAQQPSASADSESPTDGSAP